MSVLFHEELDGTIVVYAEGCGWESLSWSLSVSSMMQDKGIWRLGIPGGEVYCCGCSWDCSLFGVLLGVI